jgi:hypothetical protein
MKIVLRLMFALIVGAAIADDGPAIHAGPLTLTLAGGWVVSGDLLSAHGPGGETLIARYYQRADSAGEHSRAAVMDTARTFASEQMLGISAKNGKPIGAVSETALPDGRALFTAASQGRKLLRPYYLLQYLVASHHGLAYLTVEGFGDAEREAQRFQPILMSQQWLE